MFQRILVPLDGSSQAERPLVPAAYLSAALSAPLQGELHLVQVTRLSTTYEEAGGAAVPPDWERDERQRSGTLQSKRAWIAVVSLPWPHLAPLERGLTPRRACFL